MPSRNLRELEELDGAYRAALAMDVSPLAACVERWSVRPMLMVGSGGSFSTASFAADLHECSTGRLARAATPLQVTSKEIRGCGVVCFTASGRNQDILTAFRAAGRRETDPLSALVLAGPSPMEELGERFRYADVVRMDSNSFADGYLAVASLVGSSVLIARAYRAVMGGSEKEIPSSITELVREVTGHVGPGEIVAAAHEVMQGRECVSVLHSTELTTAAVDMESRFVEAALGALHFADLRNFGHGRHFWMARKANETCVVALISEAEEELGYRTVALLPKEAATLPIRFRGSKDVQGIAGLVASIFIAASAARLAGIDPRRPGVPGFGRKLYRLRVKTPRLKQAELNRAAALRRKGAREDDSWWIEHYEHAFETINSVLYRALVLDYDGTLCDRRERKGRLRAEIVGELRRLGEEGAVIGLATGRGPSAGVELRKSLPCGLHGQVLVGYYNSAVILPLSDRGDPIVEESSRYKSLVVALKDNPMLDGKVRANAAQISIGVRAGVRVEDGAEEVRLMAQAEGCAGDVVTSAHSIDLCLVGQSKDGLFRELREWLGVGEGPILRIGDRGRPPGNDWKLLDDPHGLSVDQVSRHPAHCWSLAPAGKKGTHATAHYLSRLAWTERGGRLRLSKSSRA